MTLLQIKWPGYENKRPGNKNEQVAASEQLMIAQHVEKKYQITCKPAMFLYNFKLNNLETLYHHSSFIILLLHSMKLVLFGNESKRNLDFSKTGSFSNKMPF